MPLTQPAEGWVYDGDGIAHQVKERGPSCYVTWCGSKLNGLTVGHEQIGPFTRQCKRCNRERWTNRGVARSEYQGRLW